MASMVLNRAQRAVVRAFVELRGLISSNKELAAKVHSLERKVSVHERSIGELADSMAALLATPTPPPKRPIGFVHAGGQGQQEDFRGEK